MPKGFDGVGVTEDLALDCLSTASETNSMPGGPIRDGPVAPRPLSFTSSVRRRQLTGLVVEFRQLVRWSATSWAPLMLNPALDGAVSTMVVSTRVSRASSRGWPDRPAPEDCDLLAFHALVLARKGLTTLTTAAAAVVYPPGGRRKTGTRKGGNIAFWTVPKIFLCLGHVGPTNHDAV